MKLAHMQSVSMCETYMRSLIKLTYNDGDITLLIGYHAWFNRRIYIEQDIAITKTVKLIVSDVDLWPPEITVRLLPEF